MHFCQALPWHKVARVDVRIPGFTSSVTQAAAPSRPEDVIGAVFQFGFRGDAARSVPLTRNEVC